jgi:tRNA A-37 threonylcarbamoyl transferase component Bud32
MSVRRAEVYQIKAQDVENMLSDIGKANAAAFYRHLGTYLTHRVRQLTAMVGEALASRVTDIPIEEVLSNGIFFSHFKRFMTEHKLVSPKMLSFLTELNDFLDVRTATPPAAPTRAARPAPPPSHRPRIALASPSHRPPLASADALARCASAASQMPGNLDQAAVAMKLHDKYLVGNPPAIVVPQEALVVVTKALSPTEVPPRDIFGPVLAVALSSLQVNAYRLFSQSSSFQPLLDLKAREEIVPLVSDFKLLQILGEGYEGKVLQARKKDCGVCYALKVLDKTILASRSRRWQMHCSRERECLIACSHPYVVGLAYSFQSPQYLYMVQEYLPNHTLASYLDAHEGHPVAVDHLRFIVAQLACGLAHIHAQDIVYRDLKPANVLVDDGGHMRIVDMGMASKLDPETKRRKSVCGTQRYMAPEMKAKELYNCSVDWYSLGKLILDCQGRSAHAEKVAREWRSSQLDGLVEGLLIKDPTKRLACTAGGVREMQMHPFFKPLDVRAHACDPAWPCQTAHQLRIGCAVAARDARLTLAPWSRLCSGRWSTCERCPRRCGASGTFASPTWRRRASSATARTSRSSWTSCRR